MTKGFKTFAVVDGREIVFLHPQKRRCNHFRKGAGLPKSAIARIHFRPCWTMPEELREVLPDVLPKWPKKQLL